MTKLQKQLLAGILLLAAVLIFFRLTRHDPLGDDAHYSFRAIGYFDYLGSKEQTTPVQWFGHRPAWSYLSFHDHPPLVFLIQHIFFSIFGVSLFVSRLPSALAALGSVLVIFFIAKRLAGPKAGLAAALALAVNNYLIWTGRIALLESVFIFFLLLSFLYLLKTFEDSKYFIHTGLFFGLSLLSKYTVLFILPAVLLFLVWKHRWIFKNKRFWQGMMVFLVLCLPVVIYNLMMFKTRGHFDVQFADLFGQVHNDWPKLAMRISKPDPNFLGVLTTIADGFSWPYFAAFILSIFFSLHLARRAAAVYLFVFAAVSLFFFFAFAGGAVRWMGVLAPFAALLVGLAAAAFAERKKYLAAAVAIPFAVFSIFYTWNTNHLKRPVAGPNWYAGFRLENYGYNQLDKEISKLLTGKKPTPKIKYATTQWWYRDLDEKAIEFPIINQGAGVFGSAIIVDSEHIWFPMYWAKEKWKFYHRFSIKTSNEFLQVVDAKGGLEIINFVQFDKIYYFKSGPRIRETADLKYEGSDPLFEAILKKGILPKIIYDDQGNEAFYMYETSELAI